MLRKFNMIMMLISIPENNIFICVLLEGRKLDECLYLYHNHNSDQKSCTSHLIYLHHLAYLTPATYTVAQLILLHAALTRHVVFAWQKYAVLFRHSAETALVALLLLSLTVALAKLALESQAAP